MFEVFYSRVIGRGDVDHVDCGSERRHDFVVRKVRLLSAEGGGDHGSRTDCAGLVKGRERGRHALAPGDTVGDVSCLPRADVLLDPSCMRDDNFYKKVEFGTV